ncbi:MAG: hypothetical protein ACRC1P_09620 [Cellulosilyticaceae bacterium]
MKRIDRTGEVGCNKEGHKMWIIRYNTALDIDVEFDNRFVAKGVRYECFKSGSIKNYMSPLVCDIGYMGVGAYKSREEGVKTKEYQMWLNMIHRCYDKNKLLERPTYIGCTVCDEWHNFQNFAQWYNDNKWTDELVLSPDKDILCHGKSKVYSPDTVLLVDNRINILFTKHDSARGEYPIGVSAIGKTPRYQADYAEMGKDTYLGLYNTPEEAFEAYKLFKEKYIKQVADEYKAKYPNFPERLYVAMYEYEVDIND